MFFFSLCYVGIEALYAGLRDCDSTSADELQDAAKCIELGEKFYHILCDASVLDDGVGGVHFHYASIISANDAGDVLIGKYHRSGELQKRSLEDEYLVVNEAVSLQDINLLFNLLGQHFRHLLLAVAGDCVLVDARSGRGANIEALDVDLATSEDCGNLIQDTCEVLGIDDEGVERQAIVTEERTFVTRHSWTSHCIAAEGLHLAAFGSILSEGSSALASQVLLEAIAINSSRRKNGFVEALHLFRLLQFIALATSVAIATLNGTIFLL